MSKLAQFVEKAAGEMTKTKKTAAKAKAETPVKKAKLAIARAQSFRPKKEPQPLPELGALDTPTVARSDKNQYVNVDFPNGFAVRMYCTGCRTKEHAMATRDLMVAWLNRELAR